MAAMKAPGVYVVDNSGFPNSVVEVATAVPAFIGYTEKADERGQSLGGKPWRITSLAEYHARAPGTPRASSHVPNSTSPGRPEGLAYLEGPEVRVIGRPCSAGFTAMRV